MKDFDLEERVNRAVQNFELCTICLSGLLGYL